MSRESLLILIGTLVALSPFVGLPLAWLAFIVPALGGVTVLIGFSLSSRKKRESTSSYEETARGNS